MPEKQFWRGTAADLRSLRERAGLSKRAACHLAGVPIGSWQNWERDPDNPRSVAPPNIVLSWLLLFIEYQKKTGFVPGRGKRRVVPRELSLERFRQGKTQS